VAPEHELTKWPHVAEADETCAACQASDTYAFICADDFEHGIAMRLESVSWNGELYDRFL
jgi:hypothetical protein